MCLAPTDSTPPRLRLGELTDRVHVLDVALNATAHALDVGAPAAPGAYLLMYHGSIEAYRQLRAPWPAGHCTMSVDGGYPIYAGRAHDLAARAKRHYRKLGRTLGFGVADVSLISMATTSPAAAVYAEAILIEEFQPVWNQRWLAGFGSQAQGKIRAAGQSASPWDRYHPARGRTEPRRNPSTSWQAATSARIADHLRARRAGNPWPGWLTAGSRTATSGVAPWRKM